MKSELIGYPNKRIDAAYHLRSPAPDDVWNHRDYETWRADIWKLIQDFANVKVQTAFLARPPEYVVGDDLSWLDEIIADVLDIDVDSKTQLAQRLRGRYRAIRAVHGTKTSDLDPFYREGLEPLAPERFHAQAKSVFLSGAFPELTEADLQRAIDAVGSDLRAGRVYFEANEDSLIEYCGHYMLYGSEYLVAIAAHLSGPRDYRRVLKERGTPTVFVCDVPLDYISEDSMLEFAGEALECVFQELLDGKEFARDDGRGAGFCIRIPLPPECLIGHYHPHVRWDPLGVR